MIDLFTKQEKLIILFLLLGLIIGIGIELYKSHFKPLPDNLNLQQLDETEKQIRQKASLIDSIIVESDRLASLSAVGTKEQNRLLAKSTTPEIPINKSKLMVNINTAPTEELVRLPQVGPVIANKIVEYRNNHGPFRRIDDLMNVKGIGIKKFTSMKPFICVDLKE